MEKFTVHTGTVVPLDRENVDTDAIIPKQFLKSIKRTGVGPHLFDAWRYADGGKPMKFEINATLKHNLVNGLDEIGITLSHADEIKAYEEKRKKTEPWIFQ